MWRRRKCLSCDAIFSTNEGVDSSQALSVQRNKSLEPFSRDQLFVSIYDSLKHRKSALSDATGLTTTVLSTIYPLTQNATIDRDAIVTVATTVLERFDRVAATHYNAFHPL